MKSNSNQKEIKWSGDGGGDDGGGGGGGDDDGGGGGGGGDSSNSSQCTCNGDGIVVVMITMWSHKQDCSKL